MYSIPNKFWKWKQLSLFSPFPLLFAGFFHGASIPELARPFPACVENVIAHEVHLIVRVEIGAAAAGMLLLHGVSERKPGVVVRKDRIILRARIDWGLCAAANRCIIPLCFRRGFRFCSSEIHTVRNNLGGSPLIPVLVRPGTDLQTALYHNLLPGL